MDLPKCKFFPNAVVCNEEKDYYLVRSACGPAYNFFTGENRMVCPYVSVVAKCPNGHEMFYQTQELKRFSSKASVQCRVCGSMIFVKDAELYCLANPTKCKKQL